jgi:cytochrome c553
MPYKLPKHIVRLLLLLVFFLLVAFAAKILLTDPSYYKYGYFRADAVAELAAGTHIFRGSAYCLSCHNEGNEDWLNGSHSTVQCEVCHGTNQQHPDDGATLIPADTIRLCTLCHEALPARPASQPQIKLSEHPFPDEETPPCHSCHDPHSPGNMTLDAATPGSEPEAGFPAEATAGPSISAPAMAPKCAKCHGKQGEGLKRNPALFGMETAIFIKRMQIYKADASKNRIMTKYANSLNDEEIEELARYYQSLAPDSLP